MPRTDSRTEEQRLTLYQDGMTDAEIGRRLNTKRHTITHWRRSRNLPVQAATSGLKRLTQEQTASRMLLYQLGWSDQHIARETRRLQCSIREWRVGKGLPANFRPGSNERHAPRPGMASVVRRIRKAVGRALAPDVIEDIVADMMVAVLEGSLPLAEIEAEARRYGNRVLERFASKFGPRSLDQEIGDGEGFTLLDTLVDDSSSSWLEEMGATVW